MTAGTTLGPEQILGLLPHRYPFLLIDRVLELTEDKVVALKNVHVQRAATSRATSRACR